MTGTKKAYGDEPLKKPDMDKLGYDYLAQQLAETIVKIESPTGFVVSVNGDWGTGKTSLLNFIKWYIEKEKGENPYLVDFNPWWFSGQEDLARKFFSQLNTIFQTWIQLVSATLI
ncbi:MAG: P-loop NTPase fold protein [Thermoproteota archaeon]